MGNIAISVSGVSKNFKLPHERVTSVKSLFVQPFKSRHALKTETQHALNDISFEVKKGEFFGIVGRNGSGKSTLLKIIAGIYQPTKGEVRVNGRLVPFIELGVGFNPELSGRDNVYLNGALMGFSTKEVDAMYDDIVSFAELEDFMDQKLKNYSSGMQVRLAFSVATRAKTDVLLIDEVLAVGDAAFQRKCFQYFRSLKKQGATVVFVSHDMAAVREFCDRALLIEESRIVDIGNTDKVAQRYAKLFLGEDDSELAGGDEARWGSGASRIEEAGIIVSKQHLKINTKITINDICESIVYGLHITAGDGVEVIALNNTMLNKQGIRNANPGELYQVEWEVMNIFSDGKYTATLTLVNESGTVLDWWVDALVFTVKKAERSTTHVLPPIKVDAVKIIGDKV